MCFLGFLGGFCLFVCFPNICSFYEKRANSEKSASAEGTVEIPKVEQREDVGPAVLVPPAVLVWEMEGAN